MIRAIRPSAMAHDDASLVTGWNIVPNVAYTVSLSVSASAVVVLLANADNSGLIGSGLALVGTDQPVTITPLTGQTIGMVDAELGWHLLITTTGSAGDRTIRIGPAVDLPDEIHPIYTDEDMAVARATAAINSGANYVDDVTATCPLGLGAGIGDIASVEVGGGTLTGQVESVTWTATPDGTGDVAVIRRHTAIAPAAHTPPATPPVVADDTAETDSATEATGNVLTNDTGTLTVSAVNGLSANVGQIVTGSNGGDFTINTDGSWAFDPSGDFSTLSGSDTATTSVTYHASNGDAEASATLTVTVSSSDAQLWTPAEITTALWLDAADNSTITLVGGFVTQIQEKSGAAQQFTPIYAGKPTYSNTQNGLSVLTFLDSPMKTGNNFSLSGNISASMFWVSSKATLTKGNVFGWGTLASGASCGMFDNNRGTTCIAFYAANFNISAMNETNVYRLHSAIKSPGSIATTTQYFRDGVSAQTSAHSTVTPNITAAKLSVGRWSSDEDLNRNFHGNLAELVILPESADAATRQRFEGYLAHKWGLATTLPSNHPYKSAPPTI